MEVQVTEHIGADRFECSALAGTLQTIAVQRKGMWLNGDEGLNVRARRVTLHEVAKQAGVHHNERSRRLRPPKSNAYG